MNEAPRRRSFWSRHRAAIVVAGVAGWVAILAVLRFGGVGGDDAPKGARELLDIGALPVT